MKKHIDRHAFYSGLLLALRALGQDSFPAEGPPFHRAFLKAVRAAQRSRKYAIKGVAWIASDPVFGVVHEANEMLLEAEQDALISLLNPRLSKARFKISRSQAQRELESTVDEAWFRSLAKHFREHLAAPE